MATSIRLTETLKAHAAAYAASLGISVNALIAVALKDYLDGRVIEPFFNKEGASDFPEQSAGKVIAYGASFSRNQVCPCGSGIKFKRCCGRSAQASAPSV